MVMPWEMDWAGPTAPVQQPQAKPWEMDWGGQSARPTPPGMEMDFTRKPKDSAFPLGNPMTDPKTQYDPIAALAQGGAAVGKYFGMSDTGAAKAGRDFYGMVDSLGPLGAVELGATNVPKPSLKPLATSDGMPRASVRSQEDLFTSGGARMNQAKQSETLVPVEKLYQPIRNLQERLDKQALVVSPSHSEASRFVNRLNAFVAGEKRDPMSKMTGVEPAPPKPRSMQELHQLRQVAEDVIGAGKRQDGRLNTEGKLGMEFKTTVDEMIEAHPDAPLLKQGMHEWSKGEKSRILTDAMEKAKNSRAWANGNEAAAIQSALRPLLDAKRYRNTWHPEERKVLQKITRRKLGNMLSTFGSTSMAGLAFGRVLEGFLGIPATSLLFLGVPARAARNKNIINSAERFGETIRAGGAVAPSGVEKLTKILSPKVFQHISANPRGAELVRRFTTGPTPQTARALALFVADAVNQPELARRIYAEIQEE
jgi:hypothetical protein